ncbi:MAG: hypothetical protein JXR45_08545 [Deltaproteobacteria bacterium]|nr:hypothetical protein [Deltaproteobacteria bacterium]
MSSKSIMSEGSSASGIQSSPLSDTDKFAACSSADDEDKGTTAAGGGGADGVEVSGSSSSKRSGATDFVTLGGAGTPGEPGGMGGEGGLNTGPFGVSTGSG